MYVYYLHLHFILVFIWNMVIGYSIRLYGFRDCISLIFPRPILRFRLELLSGCLRRLCFGLGGGFWFGIFTIGLGGSLKYYNSNMSQLIWTSIPKHKIQKKIDIKKSIPLLKHQHPIKRSQPIKSPSLTKINNRNRKLSLNKPMLQLNNQIPIM